MYSYVIYACPDEHSEFGVPMCLSIYRKNQVEPVGAKQEYCVMIDFAKIPWDQVENSLDLKGYASIPSALSSAECQALIASYQNPTAFRSTISMERYRFGKGEYKYYAYPLPELIQLIRSEFYPPLAQVANSWMKKLSIDIEFPASHHELIARCHAANQKRPTALILHYEKGGFNTLHQDLYGDIFFPFQVVFVLSEPGVDFKGAEFVLVEQLPRAQSKAQVLNIRKGDALIFTTNFRPVSGSRGYYRSKMKHGVSELLDGERYAMGVIFHDAS